VTIDDHTCPSCGAIVACDREDDDPEEIEDDDRAYDEAMAAED
jgi:hypothetical protein